jgi:glycerol uptake facilitator-like aquaporin
VDRALAPFVIGAALGLGVMVMGSLTGAGFNPARAFGPAIVSGEWDGADNFLLAYVLAPVLGALAASLAYVNIFMAPGTTGEKPMEPVG